MGSAKVIWILKDFLVMVNCRRSRARMCSVALVPK